MKRILLYVVVLALTVCTVASSFLFTPSSGGGGGTTNASDLASGTVASARGGTGQDSSASTGVPYVLSGTWSFKTFAQFMALMGVTYNPADNTWAFLASISAPDYVSIATDNTRGAAVPNTADPTGSNLAAGKLWFNTTSNLLKVRNGDNTTTRELLTSASTNTGNFSTTGTLNGGQNTSTHNDNATLSGIEVYGSWIEMGTTSDNIYLPAVSKNMSVCIMAMDNVQKRIIPNGSDKIVYFGTDFGTGHYALSVAAGATAPLGEFLCLKGSSSNNQWIAIGRGASAWTDGGAP